MGLTAARLAPSAEWRPWGKEWGRKECSWRESLEERGSLREAPELPEGLESGETRRRVGGGRSYGSLDK